MATNSAGPAGGEVQVRHLDPGHPIFWPARARLVRVERTLDAALQDDVPALSPLVAGAQGYELTSLSLGSAAAVRQANPDFIAIERERYPRHYIRLDMGFDAYAARFSTKARAGLRRKTRRWIGSAGKLDIVAYRRPHEIATFRNIAWALSARTYQERLLGAGLPSDRAAEDRMQRLAAQDALRAFVLFHGDVAASYLYLPIADGCIRCTHMGYDPAYAALSPGAVLQLAAIEALFAEGHHRLFDFGAGDGAHERLFATDHVDCVDLVLLRRTLPNRLLASALSMFARRRTTPTAS